MDVGTLDLRRKKCPEGFYRGIIMSVKWKPVVRNDEKYDVASVRVQLKTDNPNVDESTVGKNVFESCPWTEEMAWKAGDIYVAANGLTEDDDILSELTKDTWAEGIVNKEVEFDVVHNTIVGNDGKPRTMVNLNNYKAVQG